MPEIQEFRVSDNKQMLVKPCPNCGHYAEFDNYFNSTYRHERTGRNQYASAYVFCPQCGLTGMPFRTIDEAILDWNRIKRPSET